MADALPIDSRHTVPAQALHWTAVRASGPGGQHVNRTESRVVLRCDPAAIPWLHPSAATRLRKLAGDSRLDAQGRILISSQATREQARNLEDARHRLAELLRAALVRPKPRIATRPTKGSVRRRLDAKRRQGEKKEGRRKVRDSD